MSQANLVHQQYQGPFGNITSCNAQQLPKVHIAPDKLQATIEKLTRDKIVLSFEAPTTEARMKQWLEAYNEKIDTPLEFYKEFCNALFVCSIQAKHIRKSKTSLLQKSLLKVFGFHASVNSYTAHFNP